MASIAARGDLSDFGRGVIVGVPLAGASFTKTAQLADVSRATVSTVKGKLREKDIISKEQQWAEAHSPGS